MNKNGLQDSSEPAIEGVRLSLINNLGSVVHCDVSDVNGNYSFDNLVPGMRRSRRKYLQIMYHNTK
ncbi:MAG: hypothetical protein IPJ39_18540 [Saprospiraceae bacterium]|nr:hypothetical protein [Saprospiraceae bacterium]